MLPIAWIYKLYLVIDAGHHWGKPEQSPHIRIEGGRKTQIHVHQTETAAAVEPLGGARSGLPQQGPWCHHVTQSILE